MYLQLGSLWARKLVVYEGRLCTYSLAVFEPGSLLCTRVDCVSVYLQLGSLWARKPVVYEGRMCTYSLAVFGPGSLLSTRVECELTAWQSLSQVACCVRG